MNRYTLIFVLVFASIITNATVPDTVVTVSGRVFSNEDNSPVKATLEYKKLPYGSEIGKITANDNGEFIFYVHGDSKYSLKVSSSGYFAQTVQLDVSSSEISNKDFGLASGDAGYVFRLENLIFQLGDDKITSTSHAELNGLVERLIEYPNMIIQLEGHTDTSGDPGRNMDLSQRRVESVKSYLVNKGVAGERIMTKAFGGTAPLSTDDDEESRAKNRRVEVRIISVN